MTQRDYNLELDDSRDEVHEKYAYTFDFDVLHPYMIKSFATFFRPGSMLELGSYKGNFTRRLMPHFSDITCVEASDAAMREYRPEKATIILMRPQTGEILAMANRPNFDLNLRAERWALN